MAKRVLGIAVIGVGGAVGTTMVAGVELLKKGVIDTTGLPLAALEVDGLADYTDIVVAGWDLFPDRLSKAAENHDVLTHKQFLAAEEALKLIRKNITDQTLIFLKGSHRGTQMRELADALQKHLRKRSAEYAAAAAANA